MAEVAIGSRGCFYPGEEYLKERITAGSQKKTRKKNVTYKDVLGRWN